MDIRSYLDQMGVDYRWSHHDPAYTAQQIAHAEHISGNKVVKPVLVRADDHFVLCALPAGYCIDVEQLRSELRADEVDLTDESALAQICRDCELGAEPPIGKLFGVPTVMDDSLRRQPEVMFQAGTHEDAVVMTLDDYLKLAEPQIAHFARPRN